MCTYPSPLSLHDAGVENLCIMYKNATNICSTWYCGSNGRYGSCSLTPSTFLAVIPLRSSDCILQAHRIRMSVCTRANATNATNGLNSGHTNTQTVTTVSASAASVQNSGH